MTCERGECLYLTKRKTPRKEARQMWTVVGTRWVSGLAVQTPTAVGPTSSEAVAENVADQMEAAGYVNVEICYGKTLKDWASEQTAVA